jgi:hypothetical protein
VRWCYEGQLDGESDAVVVDLAMVAAAECCRSGARAGQILPIGTFTCEFDPNLAG